MPRLNTSTGPQVGKPVVVARKIRVIMLFWIAGAALIFSVGVFPPASGYYYLSSEVSSNGVLHCIHLQSGRVEEVSVGGGIGDFRGEIGEYSTTGRRIYFVLRNAKPEHVEAEYGWTGIALRTESKLGIHEFVCHRVFSPWAILKLNNADGRSN